MRHPLVKLLIAGATAVVLACGDSSGPGPRTVALFTNPNFVDYDTSDIYSEASQWDFTLAHLGATVTPFTGIDSAGLASILSTNGALVIPTTGGFALDDSLTAAAAGVIRDFVDSLGGLLVLSTDNVSFALLDSLWGYQLAYGGSLNYYPLNTSDAAGTPFGGGPVRVWDNDGTQITAAASFPAAAKLIYATGTDVALAVIPQGNGTVVLLGWNLEAALPHGPQDGGWIEALRRMLRL